MRCAIYCRLSREDENKIDESESIQNQRLLLHQYAADRGWTVCAEYVDDDRSGADADRPGFQALLRDAEAGRFEILLCKTQSRFTRDLELSEHYLHRRFVEWGVRFISVVDGVDTGRRDNLKTRQLGGLINEWYLADLSDNVRAVLDAKRRRGDFIGSFAPYGYRKSRTERGRLEPDPEAAAVVREIFRLAGDGISYAEIARWLNARGVPNPTAYKLMHGEHYFNGRFAKQARSYANAGVSERGETNDSCCSTGGNPATQIEHNSIHGSQTGAAPDTRTGSTPDASHAKSAPSGICNTYTAQLPCSSEWSRSTVSRILRNECYLGAAVQGKREKISYKSKRLRERERSDWIVVYDVNPPIVTREEFERANRSRRRQ